MMDGLLKTWSVSRQWFPVRAFDKEAGLRGLGKAIGGFLSRSKPVISGAKKQLAKVIPKAPKSVPKPAAKPSVVNPYQSPSAVKATLKHHRPPLKTRSAPPANMSQTENRINQMVETARSQGAKDPSAVSGLARKLPFLGNPRGNPGAVPPIFYDIANASKPGGRVFRQLQTSRAMERAGRMKPFGEFSPRLVADAVRARPGKAVGTGLLMAGSGYGSAYGLNKIIGPYLAQQRKAEHDREIQKRREVQQEEIDRDHERRMLEVEEQERAVDRKHGIK